MIYKVAMKLYLYLSKFIFQYVCYVFADAYTADQLQYKWHSHPGITLLDIEMPQFSLEGFQTKEHIITYAAGTEAC